MKKGLAEYREDSYELSKRTSDISRQLAFAGIAIIWIYKNPDESPAIIKDGLLFPLFLFVLSLGIDLLQHFIGALCWYIFYQIKERQYNNGKIKKNEDITGPFWINYTATGLFFIKIIFNISAYIELGKFFFPKLGIL